MTIAFRSGMRSTPRAGLDLERLETLGLIRLLEVVGEAANAVTPHSAKLIPKFRGAR